VQALAFSGIHVISPRFLSMMTGENAFSIIDCYLQAAAHDEAIVAFRADAWYWRDLGSPDSLAQAAQDLTQGVLR
jgi:NDP-sugar pyrophosphorylase family protein